MPLQKHILTKSKALQFRLARNVDPSLQSLVQSICGRTPEVLACYLLDMRKAVTARVVLAVAIHTATDRDFEVVADRISVILNEYPQYEEEVVLIQAQDLAERFAGHECYRRS